MMPPSNKEAQLARVILNVRAPTDLASFYTEFLGMASRQEGEIILIGYGGSDAEIELHKAHSGNYLPQSDDRYWKIGITMPNIDIAARQLKDAGIEVSAPRQFQNIGYMCHLTDPEGFAIELLQHDFEHNRPADAGDVHAPLGGGARIGQITLRTTEIEEAHHIYHDQLGMRLLSVQPVSDFGFTLYFYGYSDDQLPSSDLQSVSNREWLWKRPYTTLELQHLTQGGKIKVPQAGEVGFASIAIANHGKASSTTDEVGAQIKFI